MFIIAYNDIANMCICMMHSISLGFRMGCCIFWLMLTYCSSVILCVAGWVTHSGHFMCDLVCHVGLVLYNGNTISASDTRGGD